MRAAPGCRPVPRGVLLWATLAATATALLTGCDWSVIPGLGLPTAPVDTTTPPPVTNAPQAWLNANVSTIRSVDFADDDFSDLEPLRAAIGDMRVVLLGEQSRYDGTTIRAKARLVRFLHEQMGFDVLVFESGAYDVHTAWNRIRSGTDAVAAARAAIPANWGASAELEPLFGYIGQRADGPRPLVLAGVDSRFTGTGPGNPGLTFADDLESYLAAYDSPLPEESVWSPFRAVAERIARQVYDSTPFTPAERNAFTAGLSRLIEETNRLVNVAPPAEASFWVTITLSLEAQARTLWFLHAGNPDAAAAIRDSSMAHSLVWLAQSVHPGRKMVVWSTAPHVMRSPNELYNLGGQPNGHGRVIFGSLARVVLGEVMYSLGFLAGAGSYGPFESPTSSSLRPLVAPLPESWDGLFYATGKPYAFLQLRRPIDEDNAWILRRRVARALDYQQLSANWTAVYDGFFFTATMHPVTPVP